MKKVVGKKNEGEKKKKKKKKTKYIKIKGDRSGEKCELVRVHKSLESSEIVLVFISSLSMLHVVNSGCSQF